MRSNADFWGWAGLKPYPGGRVPHIGDPQSLDDTELLRRLMPLTIKLWRKSHPFVRLDDESLFNRILFDLYQAARKYDPAQGKLVTLLFAAGQWSWQSEANDARLVGPRRAGGHFDPAEAWTQVPTEFEPGTVPGGGDRATSLLDLLPSREPDPADFDRDPDAEFAHEGAELADLLGLIPSERQREAVRLRFVNGLSSADAATELGTTPENAYRLAIGGLNFLRDHPQARELVGLPPAVRDSRKPSERRPGRPRKSERCGIPAN